KRTMPSQLPLAASLPVDEMATHVTGLLCWANRPVSLPSWFHRRTVSSSLAEARYDPSGAKATAVTVPWCAANFLTSRPCRVSQQRIQGANGIVAYRGERLAVR